MSVEKAKNVPPFVLWCSATIPTAFDDSMSYYEALCALYKFIQDNLVEPINNNATVLEKTVEDMKELKEYVDTYFDNLDIQEEINNKLDAMAEGGQLQTIIAQFLATAPVFAYATISDMAAATNLNDGCIARVLGNTDASAGDGAYYKIRTKESGETADGIKKVAIGNDLIGDRIINLPPRDRKVIIIGDSYANRTNSWADRIKAKAGLSDADCNIRKYSGVGFVNSVDNVTFESLLTSSITIDPKEVTDIIVCGGWNDGNYSEASIISAIESFVDTATSTYPNANVYIGYISWFDCEYENISESAPFSAVVNGRAAYKKGAKYGTKTHYLNNVEYALHNQSEIDSSHFHPTSEGQENIANAVMGAWLTGSCDINSGLVNVTSDFTPASTYTSSDLRFYSIIENSISRLMVSRNPRLTFDQTPTYNLNGTRILLGKLTGGYVIGRGSTTTVSVSTLIRTTDGKYYKQPTSVDIDRGNIYWRPKVIEIDGTNWVLSKHLDYVEFDNLEFIIDSVVQY